MGETARTISTLWPRRRPPTRRLLSLTLSHWQPLSGLQYSWHHNLARVRLLGLTLCRPDRRDNDN